LPAGVLILIVLQWLEIIFESFSHAWPRVAHFLVESVILSLELAAKYPLQP